MPDLSQYSNEDLLRIVGVKPDRTGLSSYSNEELMQIAGVKPTAKGQPVEAEREPFNLGRYLVEKVAEPTIEAGASLIGGIAAYLPSKLYGAAGMAARRDPRVAEEEMAGLVPQPKTEAGRRAVEPVSKAFEIALTPARKIGEVVTDVAGPNYGYVAEFLAELALFKGAHVAGKGIKAVTQKPGLRVPTTAREWGEIPREAPERTRQMDIDRIWQEYEGADTGSAPKPIPVEKVAEAVVSRPDMTEAIARRIRTPEGRQAEIRRIIGDERVQPLGPEAGIGRPTTIETARAPGITRAYPVIERGERGLVKAGPEPEYIPEGEIIPSGLLPPPEGRGEGFTFGPVTKRRPGWTAGKMQEPDVYLRKGKVVAKRPPTAEEIKTGQDRIRKAAERRQAFIERQVEPETKEAIAERELPLGKRIVDEVKQPVDTAIAASQKGKTKIANMAAEKARKNAEIVKTADGPEVEKLVNEQLERLPKEEVALGMEAYIQAKKNPAGHYQLFFRGTRNEIFPGEKFKTANEARQYWKAQKVKQQKSSPETIAKDLGVIYNGVQEGVTGKIAGYLFTDKKTKSTFSVKELTPADVKTGLKEVRERYEKVEKPAAEAPAKPKAKEPWEIIKEKEVWQIPRQQYVDAYIKGWEKEGVKGTKPDDIWAWNNHKFEVQEALKEGKPIPPEVLKDYPELLKGKEKPTEPEIKVTGTAKEKEVTQDLLQELREGVTTKTRKPSQQEISQSGGLVGAMYQIGENRQKLVANARKQKSKSLNKTEQKLLDVLPDKVSNITHYSNQLAYGHWENVPRAGLKEQTFRKTLNSLLIKGQVRVLGYESKGKKLLHLVKSSIQEEVPKRPSSVTLESLGMQTVYEKIAGMIKKPKEEKPLSRKQSNKLKRDIRVTAKNVWGKNSEAEYSKFKRDMFGKEVSAKDLSSVDLKRLNAGLKKLVESTDVHVAGSKTRIVKHRLVKGASRKTLAVKNMDIGQKYTSSSGLEWEVLSKDKEGVVVQNAKGTKKKWAMDRVLTLAEKTGEDLMAPEITEYDSNVIRKLPELSARGISTFYGEIENPIRVFEELGKPIKELIYDKMRGDEVTAKKEFRALIEESKKVRKGLTLGSQKRIGSYAVSQQRNGAAILKNMGEKVPKLTPKELKAYSWMRTKFEEFFKRTNEARIASGKEPFAKVDNYFTFMRVFSLQERMGWTPHEHTAAQFFAEKYQDFVQKHYKTTPFRFAKERKASRREVRLDAFNVFEIYAESALQHIHKSPHIAFGRELLLKFPDGFELKKIKPNTASFLTQWLDAAAGQRRKWFPPKIERALGRLNNNLTYAVLSANIRSALIQPTAFLNTVTEIGPRFSMEGVQGILRPKIRRQIMDKSMLITRQYDVAVREAMSGLTGKIGAVKKAVAGATLKPLSILDMETAMATWWGAYQKALKIDKLAEAKARVYADDVVTKTQASALEIDLAPIQRTAVGRTLSLFQTFVINNWNFLAKDVIGLKNPRVSKAVAIKKAARWVVGATLINMLYEDVLQYNSPLPTPIRAFTEAYEKGDSIPEASLRVAREVAELVPILGGSIRYGSGIGGPLVELGSDLAKKLADMPGPKRSWFDIGGRLVGLPGTRQIEKTKKRLGWGYTLPEAVLGTGRGKRATESHVRGLDTTRRRARR